MKKWTLDIVPEIITQYDMKKLQKLILEKPDTLIYVENAKEIEEIPQMTQ